MNVNFGVVFLIASLLFLGLLSQWIAWRIKLPAILFLLMLGILLGPILGWLRPDAIFGPLLFPAVSLCVAIILFEGALSLRLSELRGLGTVIQRLLILGVFSTWTIISIATHWLAHFPWPMAVLFGAVTVVSGPTVIAPILRSVRPNAKIAKVLRWESILIDPIGVLLSVIVFEALVAQNSATASLGEASLNFLRIVAVGVTLGVTGGFTLGWILRRRVVPDYLHPFLVLASVLMIFALSDVLVKDSGLLAVTLIGMVLSNMRDVPLDNILDFKESLSILLISLLFIILAARLNLTEIRAVLGPGLGLLVVIQVVAQPIKVALASWGSELHWREQVLVAWIAPRGIVAAATAAVLGQTLQAIHYPHASLFVPLTFALIITSVLLPSLTARPLAMLLNVDEKEPQSILIIGANPVAQVIAKALDQAGFAYLLLDNDFAQIRKARATGINTFYAHPVSVQADRYLDLLDFGYMLGLAEDHSLNIIASMRYKPEFGLDHVFILTDENAVVGRDRQQVAEPYRGSYLFGGDVTYSRLSQLLDNGWKIHTTLLSENFSWESYQEQHKAGFLPLFMITGEHILRVLHADETIAPVSGDRILALIAPTAA
ncbi:sodium:proton antiporter [Ferrovum sp.]|uniref:cation:proton antiporter n=1 Tax=Ferrovum sp. TaxID=2609467 RepID=UPI00260F22EC|nr:sodium:proton antiporter [Ferrovum sp.]